MGFILKKIQAKGGKTQTFKGWDKSGNFFKTEEGLVFSNTNFEKACANGLIEESTEVEGRFTIIGETFISKRNGVTIVTDGKSNGSLEW